MNNTYKNLSINFKNQDKEIYDWLKKYADKNGYSFSHIIRELIKKAMESNNDRL